MGIIEIGESSNVSRHQEMSFVRNADENDIPNRIEGARSYARSENSRRLRWSDSLHRRFVRAVESFGGAERATPRRILNEMTVRGLTACQVKSHLQMYRRTRLAPLTQEAREAAKEDGDDPQYVARLPESVKWASRRVTRRQTRLQRNKAPVVETTVDTHLSDNLQPDDPLERGYGNNVTTVQIDGGDEKMSHSYLVFDGLLRNETLDNSAEQKRNEKGKAKMIYPSDNEAFQMINNETTKMEYYKDVLNKSKSCDGDHLKLSLEMGCSSKPANHDKFSLELTL